MKRLILTFGILIFALTTCIDPYLLELDEYESLLVVDGLITDESAPYTIKLSRTFQDQDTPPLMVSNAVVSVKDENGVITIFQEKDTGIYKSDPMQFTGRVGGTYTLHIKTNDGLEYESDSSLMNRVPVIDSIYFALDRKFINNGSEVEEGIRIFLDASNKNKVCKYFRWEYDEAWEFQTPYPARSKYLGGVQFENIPLENHICWKYGQSNEVLIHSTEQQQSDLVSKQPLKFIAPEKSDRLMSQYCILVRQYSLSLSEYEFWSNLKVVSESEGDIFEKQPFLITGNIHCINSEDEKILGYFKVSALHQMRMYITPEQLKDMDIPLYKYPCNRIEYGATEYLGPDAPFSVPPGVYEEIYDKFINNGFVLVAPYYKQVPGGAIFDKFIFTTKECSDCSLTGDPDKPWFWVDLP